MAVDRSTLSCTRYGLSPSCSTCVYLNDFTARHCNVFGCICWELTYVWIVRMSVFVCCMLFSICWHMPQKWQCESCANVLCVGKIHCQFTSQFLHSSIHNHAPIAIVNWPNAIMFQFMLYVVFYCSSDNYLFIIAHPSFITNKLYL